MRIFRKGRSVADVRCNRGRAKLMAGLWIRTDMTAKSATGRIPSGGQRKARQKPKTPRLGRGQADERIPDILDAATAVFIEKGFVGARMDDIAERLGVSKPILYRHFKSKDVLLEKVLFRELTSRFVQTTDAIRLYSGALKPLMQAVLARTNPDPASTQSALPIFRLILSDGYRVPEFAQALYRDGFKPVNEAMQDVFLRAMDDGRMRRANTEFAAREMFAPYWHTVMMMTILGRDQFESWQARSYFNHATESFCRSYDIAE